jgi:UDP-N-acetylmuramate: L-alanyl-gamma-D-glutamyl-meso-diaminopimelate ligase
VRGARDDLNRRKCIVGSELRGESGDDLADLHDLLRRTGDERGKRFPWLLPEHAQAPVFLHRPLQHAIVRKRRDDFRERDVEREVMRVNVTFEGIANLPDTQGATAYNPVKPSLRPALPPEGLAAFQRSGQIEIRNIDSGLHFCYKLARGIVKRLNKEVNTIHFVGIAGTAMASVAAMCRDLGLTITGSDENVYPPMSTFLEARGIRFVSGYRESNAAKRGNPEIERVLDERLNYCSLPELVRDRFIRGKRSIVVAGTHGKTTTTSLLAWVLESAGLEPGFLIGGIPTNFGYGARAAEGRFFVVEGDEYDTAFFDKRSKFVHYAPDTVILNNIEFDHADIFPDLAAVKRAFCQLVALVPRRGLIIANGDDANVREIVEGAQGRVKFFTLADYAGYALPLAGDHNHRNAAAVAVCAGELGLTRGQIQSAFASFAGVKRRMEVRGEAAGVTVLDDFAHHPTAIAETIRAIREKYPRQRVWALFEPRSNTTRRNVLQAQLTEALAEADGVYISRVDRLQELPESERLDPDQVVATLQARGKPARYAAGADEIVSDLTPQLRAGDVVGVFSNGGFGGIHDKLLTRLQA